jgi:hypothetical protein
MSQDSTFHQPISSWFFYLIEYVKTWFMQGKNRKEENYFLIN